jgi:hypothetical protein
MIRGKKCNKCVSDLSSYLKCLSYNSTVLLEHVGAFSFTLMFLLSIMSCLKIGYQRGIHLKRLRKITKNISQMSVYSGRYFNQVPPENKSRALPLHPTVRCQACGNTKRANNFKMSSTKLIYNIHFGRSSLYSHLLARMNLHFNHSISRNVRQNKRGW